MLSEIQEALAALGVPVYYGKAGTLTAEDVWDYAVFYRRTIGSTGSKTGFSQVYEVALVFEEFVPDEKVWACIEAMESVPGMRLAETGGVYQYTTKPNTEQVIEILTIDFVRPMKRGANV